MLNMGINSKKRAMVGFLAAGLMLAASGAAYADQQSEQPSGAGTSSGDPYLIANIHNLVWLKDNAGSSSGKFYKMTADIDASETVTWNDSGTDTSVYEGFKPIPNFQGHFDGDGHIITDLVINRPEQNEGWGHYIGLFGSIETSGHVHNLGLVDSTVTGEDSVGGLVGQNEGTVSDCYATGTVEGTDESYGIGGLVGVDVGGAVSDCYATGTVSGDNRIGGLIGDDYGGTVENCYATGDITGYNSGAGGLIGWTEGSYVSYCYAIGEIVGFDSVGGLIGLNDNTTVEFCHTGLGLCGTGGDVTGKTTVGGLIGENVWGCTVSECFATGNVSGHSTVGGLVGRNSLNFAHEEYNTVSDCYATGAVTGVDDESDYTPHSDSVGGLVGQNWHSSVSRCYSIGAVTVDDSYDVFVGGLVGTNVLNDYCDFGEGECDGTVDYSYWDTQTSGQADVEPYGRGEGKTTAEMKDCDTYGCWDFDDVWDMICDETYPYLRAFPYLVPFAVGEIVARNVFYNNSAYDNNDVDIDTGTGADTDSAAIDTRSYPKTRHLLRLYNVAC